MYLQINNIKLNLPPEAIAIQDHSDIDIKPSLFKLPNISQAGTVKKKIIITTKIGPSLSEAHGRHQFQQLFNMLATMPFVYIQNEYIAKTIDVNNPNMFYLCGVDDVNFVFENNYVEVSMTFTLIHSKFYYNFDDTDLYKFIDKDGNYTPVPFNVDYYPFHGNRYFGKYNEENYLTKIHIPYDVNIIYETITNDTKVDELLDKLKKEHPALYSVLKKYRETVIEEDTEDIEKVNKTYTYKTKNKTYKLKTPAELFIEKFYSLKKYLGQLTKPIYKIKTFTFGNDIIKRYDKVNSIVIRIHHNNIYHRISGLTTPILQNMGEPEITVQMNIMLTQDEEHNISNINLTSYIDKYIALYNSKETINKKRLLSIDNKILDAINLKSFVVLDYITSTTNSPHSRLLKLNLLYQREEDDMFLKYEGEGLNRPTYKDWQEEVFNDIIQSLSDIARGKKKSKVLTSNEAISIFTAWTKTKFINIMLSEMFFLDYNEKEQLLRELYKRKVPIQELIDNEDLTKDIRPIANSPIRPDIMLGAPLKSPNYYLNMEHNILPKLSKRLETYVQSLNDYFGGYYKAFSDFTFNQIDKFIDVVDTSIQNKGVVKNIYKKQMSDALKLNQSINNIREITHTMPSKHNTTIKKNVHNEEENQKYVVKPSKENQNALDKKAINDIAMKTIKDYLYKSFQLGNNKFYPGVKVFFIEDNSRTFMGDINPVSGRSEFADADRYFSSYRVLGVSVHKDKYKPDDNAIIYFYNPAVYTQAYKDDSKPAYINTEDNIEQKFLIMPGTKVQIWMGYGNNPDNYTLIFNGVITGADANTADEVMAQNGIRRLLAQGYGRELLNPINEDIGEDLIATFDTVYDLQKAILSSPDCPHLGYYDVYGSYTSRYKWDWLHVKRLPAGAEDNIYYTKEELKLLDSFGLFKFSTDDTVDTYVYTGQTKWEMLASILYRFPSKVHAVLPYGDRATYYFGPRFGYYFSRPPKNKLEVILKEAFNKTYSSNIFEFGPKTYDEKHQEGWFFDRTPFSSTEYITMFAQYSGFSDDIIQPFAKMHIIDSNINLIANAITIDDNPVYTKVNIRYDGEVDPKTMVAKTEEKLTVKLHDAIPDEYIRVADFPAYNCRSEFYAKRFASKFFIDSLNKMYSGKVITIGDPTIKPHDIIFLSDDKTNMYGFFEVREVLHIIDAEMGFITVITPGFLTMANDFYTGDVIGANIISFLFGVENANWIANLILGFMGLTDKFKSMFPNLSETKLDVDSAIAKFSGIGALLDFFSNDWLFNFKRYYDKTGFSRYPFATTINITGIPIFMMPLFYDGTPYLSGVLGPADFYLWSTIGSKEMLDNVTKYRYTKETSGRLTFFEWSHDELEEFYND